MKNLSLFLLASSFPLFGQPSLFNYTELKAPFEKILYVVKDDLGLDTAAIDIFICYSRFKNNFPDDGQATISYLKTAYTINMNEGLFRTEQAFLFLHELVHISQIMKKELIIKKYYVWYKGGVFNSGIYEELPYEKEAIKVCSILFQKYKIRKICRS